MVSPFPGMDPFLEDATWWPDFRFRFFDCWAVAIADQLPAEYEANLGERVYLAEVDPEARKLIYPDVSVSEPLTPNAAVPNGGQTAVAAMEPVTIPLQIVEGPREAYIEILHRPERALVAVLELLSPTNKQEPGRTEFLSKRNAVIHQPVHLVELDLLLGGRRLPMSRPLPMADYYYLVSHAERRPDCAVYSWHLAQRLQPLPVPLRPPHADLQIDLAQVFAAAYERG